MQNLGKGQATSMYTLIGVLLVSVFALFLFVTESGNQAENLETLITTDASYNAQLELRNLYERTIPVPREENIQMIDLITYGCKYGNKSNRFEFTFSREQKINVKAEERIEKHLNNSLGSNYRMEVNCEKNGRKMVMGTKIPEDADKIIASEVQIPLPSGNKTDMRLNRW